MYHILCRWWITDDGYWRVASMTGESAERAALGAGAIVMDLISSNDKRMNHEKIERIRQLRPDMILMAGGEDGEPSST